MNELKKALTLPKFSYYETHLSLVNCLLPKSRKMTDREIEVLAAFMLIRGDLENDRFGTTARKMIREKLKMTPQNLSNFLGTLKEKKLLLEVGDMLEIWPILIPQKEQQFYQFRLINNGE